MCPGQSDSWLELCEINPQTRPSFVSRKSLHFNSGTATIPTPGRYHQEQTNSWTEQSWQKFSELGIGKDYCGNILIRSKTITFFIKTNGQWTVFIGLIIVEEFHRAEEFAGVKSLRWKICLALVNRLISYLGRKMWKKIIQSDLGVKKEYLVRKMWKRISVVIWGEKEYLGEKMARPWRPGSGLRAPALPVVRENQVMVMVDVMTN